MGVIGICNLLNSVHLRSQLKLFTQGAAQQLKDSSFHIFGALTENALVSHDEGSVRTDKLVMYTTSDDGMHNILVLLACNDNAQTATFPSVL